MTPAVAKALALVSYNIVTIEEAFGQSGIKDPEIIEWCVHNSAVWIHADDSARRDHRIQIQTSGIVTLRVHRPRGGMTGREQLRILSYVLPKFLDDMNRRHRGRHFRAFAQTPLSRPSISSENI